MFEIVKKRIVRSLIDEIGVIGATELELVGHNIISVIEGQRLIHHGINKDYKPSGYTVDSFSNNSKIIGEYSTDKGYFYNSAKKDKTPIYEKIFKDIDHAIKHCKPEKIYLISSELEPPSFRANFNKTTYASIDEIDVIIYDSRELSKIIYEQTVDNTSAESFYRQFFPGFAKDIDNYEYYGKVPSLCDRHIQDGSILNIIDQHFKTQNICILCGVSGAGKTQQAINYIHSRKDQFANFLWISGHDWNKDQSLNSIQRSRGGTPINIAGLFNSAKTILIIDDLNRVISSKNLDELLAGFLLGGKVLVTSQLSNSHNIIYLPAPLITNTVALEIIGESTTRPSLKGKQVVKLCKFNPLILSIIRSLTEVEEVNRQEIYNEILDNPEVISDNNGELIISKILGNLDKEAHESLVRIANSGSSTHDSDFLKDFIGIFNRSRLQKLSILLPAALPGMLKVHDLICDAVRIQNNGIELVNAIQKYLEKSRTMSPSITREIHLCYDSIQKVFDSRNIDQIDWLTYVLLQIEGSCRSKLEKHFWDKPFQPGMTLPSVLCLIDAREAHAYTINSDDARKDFFNICISEYKASLETTTEIDIKIEFLHHLGKSYRRTGSEDDSLKCFQNLLEIDPKLHAAYLQIAHLGSQKDSQKNHHKVGEQNLEKLVDFICNDFLNVPLRVSLAAIARLRSYKELVKKINSEERIVQSLADVIVMSSMEGFGQFFEAFVSFTSLFGYNHSSVCITLLEKLPELLTISPDDIDKYQWLNTCEAFTNISIAASREAKNSLSQKTADLSTDFAVKISSTTKLNSYSARALAKSFVNNKKPDKALEVINKVPDDRHDHWLIYQKTKALIENNCPKDALDSAKSALDLAKRDKHVKSRLAIYYDQLSKCYELNGLLDEAINELKTAIDLCSNDKYSNELKERLKKLN